MINKLFRFLLMTTIAFAMFACEKKAELVVDPVLEISTEDQTVILSGEANTKSITVNTNGQFTAVADSVWCTITNITYLAATPAQSSFTINVAKNTVEEPRTATVTVSLETKSITIAVTQEEGEPDGKKDKPAVLIPAYVEIDAADASITFTGDAGDKEITVIANREIEVTFDEAAKAWLEATITPITIDATTGIGTAKLTLKVDTNTNAYKGRSATVTLAAIATPNRTDDDVSGVSTSIKLNQSIFGLPEADLLNVVFTVDAVGTCAARDISPAQNVITDGLPNTKEDFECKDKVYPTVSDNTLYGRPTAHFAGGTTCNNGRSSCFYKVDLVNYSVPNLANYYNPLNLSTNSQIPFTALGEGIMKHSYTVEVLFKPAQPANGYNRGKVLGWTQSCGGSVDFSDTQGDHQHRLGFYNDMAPTEYAPSNGGTEPMSPDESAKWKDNKYYHLIGVYDKTNATHKLYVDGALVDTKTSEGLVVKLANPKSTDALAQWLGIGGDCRSANPVVNGSPLNPSLNTDLEDWCEFAFTGEVVLVRFYGRVLSATEVTTLYEYEKPELE
jgi:hypothetical protein